MVVATLPTVHIAVPPVLELDIAEVVAPVTVVVVVGFVPVLDPVVVPVPVPVDAVPPDPSFLKSPPMPRICVQPATPSTTNAPARLRMESVTRPSYPKETGCEVRVLG